MLKVLGRANSSNVQKVMWTIGELGLAHERVDLGGAFGGLDKPDYVKLNPNGVVPTLIDGDLVMWESNAMVRHLASKHDAGGLWPSDPNQRAIADMWMDWQQTTLLRDWVAVFFGVYRTPEQYRDKAANDAAIKRLGGHYATVDARLEGRRFIAGDRLTMGDIPLGMSLYRYFEMDIERPKLPNVEAWYARLQERPAYREHAMVDFSSMKDTLIPPGAKK